jgi:hypothetical protein
VFGNERPEQSINVFTSFNDVIAFIQGGSAAPAIATA